MSKLLGKIRSTEEVQFIFYPTKKNVETENNPELGVIFLGCSKKRIDKINPGLGVYFSM